MGPTSEVDSRTAWVTSPATTAAAAVGHVGRVGVGTVLRVVGHQTREPLGDSLGGNDAHGATALGIDLLGHGDDVLVVGEDDDLGSRHRLDRGDQLRSRGVHRLATGHDGVDTHRPQDGDHTRADPDGHHRRGHRVSARGGGTAHLGLDPLALLELLEQVGDPDLVRATDGDAALDGRTDVVAVDVAVEDSVATHDHDRVAHLGPRGLEPLDLGIGCVEEEHDLVAQVGDRRLVAVALEDAPSSNSGGA